MQKVNINHEVPYGVGLTSVEDLIYCCTSTLMIPISERLIVQLIVRVGN